MKTSVIVSAVLLVGLTGFAQDQQTAAPDKESYKFRLIDMTIIAGPGAVYTGSLKSITDSSLHLIPLKATDGYIELFFPYDRIDTILVSSRHYSYLKKTIVVHRDAALFLKGRQQLDDFIARIITTMTEEKNADEIGAIRGSNYPGYSKADRYLRNALIFNSLTAVVEGTGLILYGIGYKPDISPVIAPGLFLSIGGIDLGKFSPIPMVKAKREIQKGLNYTAEDEKYQAALKKINTALALSTVSILTNIAGEVMLVVALFRDPSEPSGRNLAYAGLAFAGIGVATSVTSSAMISGARKALNTSAGTVGLSAGKDGLGVAYRLP